MFLFAAKQVSTVIVDYKFYYLHISFDMLARDCLATLPKEKKESRDLRDYIGCYEHRNRFLVSYGEVLR